MTDLWTDLVRAARNLLRSPGFTAAALLSLALGIGANMAAFSIVNTLLLKPLGVSDPGRLVVVSGRMPGVESLRFSWFDLDQFREHATLISPYARSHWPVSLKGQLQPEVGLAAAVSGNYFEALGALLSAGRGFDSQEETPVAVISYRFWQVQFDSDPAVIGKTVWINKRPYTVSGIAPQGFSGELAGMPVSAWVPLSQVNHITPFPLDLRARGSRYLDIGARLRPGATPAQASAEIAGLCSSLAGRFPDTHGNVRCFCSVGASTRFPIPGLAQGLHAFLAALSCVVGLLLLIACSNVAHLLMVRSTSRQGEIALRKALGATRWRIAKYLLTESILLGIVGGLAGMLVNLFVLDFLGSFKAPSPLPVVLDFSPDWRVFGFTLGLSVITGAVFGLLPALRASRLNLTDLLREHMGAWHAGRRGGRTQTILAVAQVALSLVLVTAAVLTLTSLRNALSFDPGFEVDRGILAKFNLSYGNYSPEDTRRFQLDVLRSVRALPGIESASLSLIPPLDFSANKVEIRVPGHAAPAVERIVVEMNFVMPDYFSTLGIPVLEGRGIEERDLQQSAEVAVVNQSMAARFWPGKSAIGRIIAANDKEIRVIGVAGDGKYFSLTEEPKSMFYVPMGHETIPYFSMHARTAGRPEKFVPIIVEELRLIDPSLPPVQVRTLREHMKLSQYPATIAGVSVGFFGLLALVMALTGVYAVMAYSVRMRTHEIGVRTALGASGRDILSLVLAKGVRILGIGLTAGVACSFAVTRLLSGVLVGVQPRDPLILAAVSISVAAAVLLACYLPARTAARLDAAASLRHE